MKSEISEERIDKLLVKTYEDSEKMGSAAADFVERKLVNTITQNGNANLVLATGASQFSFLKYLKEKATIDWKKITVFHLDEYVGISKKHPASFRRYLAERILNEVQPQKIHYLNGEAEHIEMEIKNYERLLKNHPTDVACIGIGENGHLAFNDPPVADFKDSKWVKIVDLDQQCRQQQVGEGWFATIDEVPNQALSLTIPAIMNAKVISCVVPDKRKAEAVRNTLRGPITTECPASILRRHPNTVLFLDENAASEL